MLDIPDHGPVVTKLGETIGVTSSCIEDVPLVTIHARLREGLADLSPEMARSLGRLLINSARKAENLQAEEAAAAEAITAHTKGGDSTCPTLTAL